MHTRLAKQADEDVHLTQTGAVVGTVAYMAPEQAMSKALDGRCDLFSLGGVLYRMCTGRLPFEKPDANSMLIALATETPPAVRELNPDVPKPLADLIMKLLAKDPAKRPASAKAVADALAVIEEDKTQTEQGILTRRASEGLRGTPSLARRVRREPQVWMAQSQTVRPIPSPRHRSV